MTTTEEVTEVVEAVTSNRKYALIAIGAVIVSCAVTGVTTHLITKKKMNADFDARLEAEVKKTVEMALTINGVRLSDTIYNAPDDFPDDEVEDDIVSDDTVHVEEPLDFVAGERIFPGEEKPTLEELTKRNQVVQYNKVLEDYGATSEDPENPVVAEPEEKWDPLTEDISVISRDLFTSNASGFEQDVVTYFVGDGQLLSMNGDFIPEQAKLIGKGRPPFGQQSDDSNAVYLRNKSLQVEYEVIKDPGKASDFLNATNGFEPDSSVVPDELMHSLQNHYNGPRSRR